MTWARSPWRRPSPNILRRFTFTGRIEQDLLELEREVLGIDHAELGALYLKKQTLPDAFVEIVQFHHQPEKAQQNSSVVAAVQVADLLVRHAKIGDSGNRNEVTEETWQ